MSFLLQLVMMLLDFPVGKEKQVTSFFFIADIYISKNVIMSYTNLIYKLNSTVSITFT